jgi:hypothetical protein
MCTPIDGGTYKAGASQHSGLIPACTTNDDLAHFRTTFVQRNGSGNTDLDHVPQLLFGAANAKKVRVSSIARRTQLPQLESRKRWRVFISPVVRRHSLPAAIAHSSLL